MTKRIDNVEQLKNAIDHGQTRGVVSHPDPAAAPLGADEEAAGTPIPREAARATASDEIHKAAKVTDGGSEPLFWPMGPLMIAVGVLVAVGIAWLLV